MTYEKIKNITLISVIIIQLIILICVTYKLEKKERYFLVGYHAKCEDGTQYIGSQIIITGQKDPNHVEFIASLQGEFTEIAITSIYEFKSIEAHEEWLKQKSLLQINKDRIAIRK